MEEVASNMTIAVMMIYLACHEVEWKCANIKSYPIFFCDSGIGAPFLIPADLLEIESFQLFKFTSCVQQGETRHTGKPDGILSSGFSGEWFGGCNHIGEGI